MKTTIHYLGTDLRGSTRVACDSNGKPVAWFGYDPFGTRVASAWGGDSNMIDRLTRRHTGQVFEQESGLYHYGARLYDDALARFVAADTAHQTPDPYAYCGNDPVDHVDPDGRGIKLIIEFDGAWYLFSGRGRFLGEVALIDYRRLPADDRWMARTTMNAEGGRLGSHAVFTMLPRTVFDRVWTAGTDAALKAQQDGLPKAESHAARNKAQGPGLNAYLESIVVQPRDLPVTVAKSFAAWGAQYRQSSVPSDQKTFYWPLRPDPSGVDLLDLHAIAVTTLIEDAAKRVSAPRVIRNRHLSRAHARNERARHSPYFAGLSPRTITGHFPKNQWSDIEAIATAFKEKGLPDPTHPDEPAPQPADMSFYISAARFQEMFDNDELGDAALHMGPHFSSSSHSSSSDDEVGEL